MNQLITLTDENNVIIRSYQYCSFCGYCRGIDEMEVQYGVYACNADLCQESMRYLGMHGYMGLTSFIDLCRDKLSSIDPGFIVHLYGIHRMVLRALKRGN